MPGKSPWQQASPDLGLCLALPVTVHYFNKALLLLLLLRALPYTLSFS
jgi:hypothetical protein